MELAGKVAVVTGGAGGIGTAMAQRFLEAGAKVVVTDVDANRLEQTTAHLTSISPDVLAVAADATSRTDIDATVTTAQERFDAPVTIYAANAGVGVGDELGDEKAWQAALEVNVMAHVRAAQALVPEWAARGEGYFVSTASAAGLLTQLGSATYATSKHAAVAFAEWLAATFGSRGVRVSCVCPMGVDTTLLQEAGRLSQTAFRAVTEAGDVLDPLDVADAVVEAMREETFLVLPHPQVLDMYRHKGQNYDTWIRGMQRYGDHLAAG